MQHADTQHKRAGETVAGRAESNICYWPLTPTPTQEECQTARAAAKASVAAAELAVAEAVAALAVAEAKDSKTAVNLDDIDEGMIAGVMIFLICTCSRWG